MRPVRVAICGDYREEGWPSMDRLADGLLAALERDHAEGIAARSVGPPFARRASRLSASRSALNIDRGLNRLVDYPRHAARLVHSYDVFHVIDHSYAQLVHRLPPGRTIVTCHDLETFRSVLDPAEEPRTAPFRAMTRHILSGLQRAAYVTCDTAAVRDRLVEGRLVPAGRVAVAPLGVDEQFSAVADGTADRAAERMIGTQKGSLEILHVGSTVPRKRIDVLLKAFALLRGTFSSARLIRVGGPFTIEQERLAESLGLTAHVKVLPALDDRTLAAVYRRAGVVLLPSEREGFGLPLVEALKCGAPVVASGIQVLREVGGPAVLYAAVGDAESLARLAAAVLRERAGNEAASSERRRRAELHVQRFTWARFASQLAAIYLELHHRALADARRGQADAWPA